MFICSVCLLNISDYIIINFFSLVFQDSLLLSLIQSFFFSFGKGSTIFAPDNDTWRYHCTLPGVGGTILMCWRSLIPTRTQNAVTKRDVLCVRYSLSFMRTGGEITFCCIEPQISSPRATASGENFYNPVVRLSLLMFTKILVSI